MVKFAKDINAPKRPQSSYFRFLADARPRIVEQYPALRSDIAAFGKYVGNLWKTVAEEDRAQYQRAADADRAEYTAKMTAYRQTEEFTTYQKARKEWTKNNKVGRKLKALKKTLVHQPKRPLSGYMQFAATVRSDLVARNPTWGVADFGRAIGELWSKLSEEEKAPFHQKYEAAKEVYQRDLAAYRETEEWTTYLAAKKNVRGAVKEAERAKKLKVKEAVKKVAEKEKARVLREKARAKKAAAKAKLQAAKEKARAKKTAAKAKIVAKKEVAKQKEVAGKEAKKAKKLAAKQRVAERKAAKKQKLADKKAAKAARKLQLKEKATARKAALRAKVLAQRQRVRDLVLRRREAEKVKMLRMRLREKAQKQRSRVLAAKK